MTTPSDDKPEWREHPEYQDYEISKEGLVYSKTSERLLLGYLNHGYPTVTLRKNGKAKACRVHVLVLEALSLDDEFNLI